VEKRQENISMNNIIMKPSIIREKKKKKNTITKTEIKLYEMQITELQNKLESLKSTQKNKTLTTNFKLTTLPYLFNPIPQPLELVSKSKINKQIAADASRIQMATDVSRIQMITDVPRIQIAVNALRIQIATDASRT
jgi:hypothetical protein